MAIFFFLLFIGTFFCVPSCFFPPDIFSHFSCLLLIIVFLMNRITSLNLSLNLAIKSSYTEPLRSQSCFFSLDRASPSSVAKNIINLISVLMIWWGPCVESSLCWKRVFAMTSAFSWQNSVSLCPVSFCTPGANLPVAQVSLDFLFLHSSPLWWTEHHFLVLVLESLVGLHKTIQLQLLWH